MLSPFSLKGLALCFVFMLCCIFSTSSALAQVVPGEKLGDDQTISFSRYNNSPYYIQKKSSTCTSIFHGYARALTLIFKESYAQAPRNQADKRVWIFDLNKRSGCPGHPGGSHTYRGMDLGYFTKGATNNTTGAGRTHVVNLKDNKVLTDVFDYKRNWKLWKRLREVFPESSVITHPLIKEYMYTKIQPSERSLFNSIVNDQCTRKADGTRFCYNHESHVHVALAHYSTKYKPVNWNAFGEDDKVEQASIVPVVNTKLVGTNNILFPVRNAAGMFNRYPAYCEGEYTIDVEGTKWSSSCSTGWRLLTDCRTLDKTSIGSCPSKALSTRTEASCVGQHCYGYNTTLTDVRNNYGIACINEQGQRQPTKRNTTPMTCAGHWFVDTSGCNWVLNCKTGWIIDTNTNSETSSTSSSSSSSGSSKNSATSSSSSSSGNSKSLVELKSCINRYITGSNKVVFPVRNTGGRRNIYPAYCSGKYWVNTKGSKWNSSCSSKWKILYNCKMPDGRKIQNCPEK